MGTRGPRSRFVDVYCPNPLCSSYRLRGQGNIAGNGTYMTRSESAPTMRIQHYICRTCGKSFSERKGTVFYRLVKVSEEVEICDIIIRILRGHSLREIARDYEIKSDTLRAWLKRAASAELADSRIQKRIEQHINLMKVRSFAWKDVVALLTHIRSGDFRDWKKQRRELKNRRRLQANSAEKKREGPNRYTY
jgi:transposase-like protein